MIPTLLVIGVVVALLLVGTAQAIWLAGVRRGRALECMEPPKHGAIHGNDGRPWPVYAENANAAIELVSRLRGWE